VGVAVVVGFAADMTVADEERQQMPFGATGLSVGVRAPMVRRGERLGQVEGNVDRHERIEREREQAEPRGPDRASPLSCSHSGAPALGCCAELT
jgi:hypothetical protein